MVDSMRKQELKSRKKMHRHKKRRRWREPMQKESTIEKYEPEVITIEKLGKHVKERKKELEQCN